jgi:regulator of replication initiation timing
MLETDFKPLFEYFDGMKSEITDRLDNMEKKVDVLQTSVDNLTKMVKDFRDEHIILHRRLETLEKWAKQVSEKLGISLPN